MKEFEKWWKQQPEHEYNPGEWYIIQKGWKAALEWALTHKKKITDVNFQCEAPVEMIFAGILKKELQES